MLHQSEKPAYWPSDNIPCHKLRTDSQHGQLFISRQPLDAGCNLSPQWRGQLNLLPSLGTVKYVLSFGHSIINKKYEATCQWQMQ